MEFRIKDVNLQCEEGGLLKIGGYVNVTERESEMLYSKRSGKWFKEIMKRGVFKSAISKAKEIPLLFEHDWNKQLATTSNRSLSLREDNIGLRFDAVIEDEEVYNQVRSGVINSCSFGFRALEDEIIPINERLEKRIVSCIELLEVSLVKNPAYVGSLVESRAYEEELEEDKNTPTEEPKDSNEEVTKDEVEKSEEKPKEEEKEESKEEDTDPLVNESKEEEDRGILVDGVQDGQEVNEPIKEDVKEALVEIVDELIEAKEDEITLAQLQEEGVKEHLETIKQEHQEIEENLERTSMLLNADIVKLRLDLIKLKNIKDGI